MLEFTDIFQLLILVLMTIITGVELYFLYKNIKKKPIIDQLKLTSLPIPPSIPPPIQTPYATVSGH